MGFAFLELPECICQAMILRKRWIRSWDVQVWNSDFRVAIEGDELFGHEYANHVLALFEVDRDSWISKAIYFWISFSVEDLGLF